MRFSLGRVLIIGGLVVGVVGAVAVALGLHATLPPDVLKVAAYKMVGIAAIGLIVAGAAVRRMELERHRDARAAADLPAGRDALPPPPPRFDGSAARAARERSYVGDEARRRELDR